MQEDNGYYLDTKVENPTPQQLFPGCDGIYNWFALSEEEKALNGWVKFDPPLYDPLVEKIEIKINNKDGNNYAMYNVVSLDTTEYIAKHFKSLVADKRWKVETAGMTIEGIDFIIPTSTEAISKISSVVTSYSTGALAENAVVDFNIGANTVKRNKTQMMELYSAITKYVQDCHSRQAEMFKEIDKIVSYKTKNAKHLQEYVSKELDKGWPNNQTNLISE